MSRIDATAANDLFAILHEPILDTEERRVRSASPELDDGAVLDLALAAAIARLRFTLNRETFDYLRWKVTIARETARARIEESRAAREERAREHACHARSFRDGTGVTWTVTEVRSYAGPVRPQRALLFVSEAAVRRVTRVPDDWEDMSEPQLLALSWSR